MTGHDYEPEGEEMSAYPDNCRQSDLDAVDLDSAEPGHCDDCGKPCLDLMSVRTVHGEAAFCCLCIYDEHRSWRGTNSAVLDACESCDSRVIRDVRRRA